MSKDPVSIREDDYMTHARQVIRDNFLRVLPVVDEGNRVLGVLSDQDVLNVRSSKSNVTVRGYIRETPLITPDMDILRAARELLDAKQHHAPVVNSTLDRTLVGILSDVDLLRHIQPTKRSPASVEEIMTTKVETAYPDDSISRIWDNMLHWDYTGIPVVSHKKEPMGIVTRIDIIKAGYARIGTTNMHGRSSGGSMRVEKVMSTPLYSVAPESSISEAIGEILRNDIGRISVTDGGKLVGIADRHDLLRACLEGTGL
jgi:CBS domain-containing protein